MPLINSIKISENKNHYYLFACYASLSNHLSKIFKLLGFAFLLLSFKIKKYFHEKIYSINNNAFYH